MADRPEWDRVLSAIVDGPVGWQSPDELARNLGLDTETANDLLAMLDVDGWVNVGEIETGVVVTLSPWGAERLGLGLAEVKGVWRWWPVGVPTPEPPRADIELPELFADVGDRRDDPELLWMAQEEQLRRLRARQDRHLPIRVEHLPTPFVFHGLATEVYREPWRDGLLDGVPLDPEFRPPNSEYQPVDPCPRCAGRKFSRDWVCFKCYGWGWDGFFARKPARRRVAC